ncbi:hypothetical protein [Embleya scabrispora]|uniref:hypothetical protein n=1 Tax=Embleya scabrispora TaxID=159449 RepID=UPI001374B4D0|nr:hypothetical protein [Embleya scabrispora]
MSGTVHDRPGASRAGTRYPCDINSAATTAPISVHAARDSRVGGPATSTGGRIRRHRRPVAAASTERTAPVVSLPPWTYRPYGRRVVSC